MSFPLYTTTKSDEWYERASKVIPSGVYGHLGPAEGQFIPVTKWPFFAEKAKGTYIWDVDGNKFIDYMCAYGPNVLGYCDPDVDAAAAKQIALGNCTTQPGKVNAIAAMGEGKVSIIGLISMVDNINRILDRVALYLA